MKLLSFLFLLSLCSCLTVQPGGVSGTGLGSATGDGSTVSQLICGKFQLCLSYPGINASGTETATATLPGPSGSLFTVGTTTGSLKETHVGSGTDILFIKSDASGLPLVIRQYGEATLPGDAGDGSDVPKAIAYNFAKTSLFIAGSTTGEIGEAPGSGSDPFIIKTDLLGNILWKKQLGAFSSPMTPTQMNGCTHVVGTTDGGVICVGVSYEDLGDGNLGLQDVMVWKLNATGTLQFVKSFGSTLVDIPKDLVLAADGDILIVGSTTGNVAEAHGGSAGATNGFIAKLDDLSGNTVWKTQMGSISFTYPVDATNTPFNKVRVDSSGGIYVLGRMSGTFSINEPRGGNVDLMLLFIDPATGAFNGIKQYGDADFPAATYSDVDYDFDLFITTPGIAYILAYYNLSGTDQILKLTVDGTDGMIYTKNIISIPSGVVASMLNGVNKFRDSSHYDLAGTTSLSLFGTLGGASDLYIYRP